MTFQEAHKNGKNGLVTRRNLTRLILENRLKNYFSDQEVFNILIMAEKCQCWTDGNIAIVYVGTVGDPRYIAIADGNYMKLIEP